MSSRGELKRFAIDLAIGMAVTAVATYGVSKLISILNPSSASKQKKLLIERLGKPELENVTFDKYETQLFDSIIANHEVDVSFDDVGGMDDIVETVVDNVIVPIQAYKQLKMAGKVVSCPTGILLYGKPGTGKTLLAKAIAKESGATFLNIKASNILSKYYGESEKSSAAIFSIARKLAPTVIFIDEIDTLLPTRQSESTDNHRNTMKGVILSEWDGLTNHNTNNSAPDIKQMLPHASSRDQPIGGGPVLVVAATNRPSDIDEAILRRLALSVEIPLPSEEGRVDILNKLMKSESPSSDLDLRTFARATEGFSGSDLRELIRVASLHRMKQMMSSMKEGFKFGRKSKEDKEGKSESNDATQQQQAQQFSSLNRSKDVDVPQLTNEHFKYALAKTQITTDAATEYREKQNQGKGFRIRDTDALMLLAHYLQAQTQKANV